MSKMNTMHKEYDDHVVIVMVLRWCEEYVYVMKFKFIVG